MGDEKVLSESVGMTIDGQWCSIADMVKAVQQQRAATGVRWLVYSREHNLWWKPNSAGYTPVIEQAGRYTREEAERICASAGVGRGDKSEFDEGPPEFCVPDPLCIVSGEARDQVGRLREAAQELVSFVAVMFGRGPDAAIPETVVTPLGIPVKVGEIMREARAALTPTAPGGGA